jgi:hypothetical protein
MQSHSNLKYFTEAAEMRTDVSVEVRVNAEITVWTLLDYTK